MKQTDGHKNVALVLLGIVAVTAIVGLVLMFVQMNATGQVYGGAIKGVEYPHWYDPATETQGRAGVNTWGVGHSSAEDYYGSNDPRKVNSGITSCGSNGFDVQSNLRDFYENQRGYTVVEQVDQWGSVLLCVYPTSAMVNSNVG